MSIRPIAASQIPRALLLAADPSWDQIRTYLSIATCYGYQQDGQIIGTILLTDERPGIREIKSIAIAPTYQHQGIAKALLNAAIAVCRQDPTCRELQIGTGNSSLRQLAIYQRAGFELVDVWVDYFVDNYPAPIYENGIQCKSMVRLRQSMIEEVTTHVESE